MTYGSAGGGGGGGWEVDGWGGWEVNGGSASPGVSSRIPNKVWYVVNSSSSEGS